MIQEMINLHKKHQYYVRVTPLRNGNGCVAQFPEQKLYEPQQERREIIYNIAKEGIDVYEQGQTLNSINNPSYATRFLIYQDIILKTLLRKIDTSLIIIEDEEGNELTDLERQLKIMDEPSDEQEKNLENNFKEVFTSVNNGEKSRERATELGVYSGYSLLRKIVRNKGIEKC